LSKNQFCISIPDPTSIKVLNSKQCDCDICVRNKSRKVSSQSTDQYQGKGDRVFKFDQVFRRTSTQEEVYLSVKENLLSIFKGFNSTVIAYGPTATGKSYTLLGNKGYEEAGIVPRVAHDIFSHIEKSNKEIEFKVELSLIELHNNLFRNLLKHYTTTSGNIVVGDLGSSSGVVEDPKGGEGQGPQGREYFSGMGSAGITTIEVGSEKDTLRAIAAGLKQRTVRQNFGSSYESSKLVLFCIFIACDHIK
jgi:hypothetical protein